MCLKFKIFRMFLKSHILNASETIAFHIVRSRSKDSRASQPMCFDSHCFAFRSHDIPQSLVPLQMPRCYETFRSRALDATSFHICPMTISFRSFHVFSMRSILFYPVPCSSLPSFPVAPLISMDTANALAHSNDTGRSRIRMSFQTRSKGQIF